MNLTHDQALELAAAYVLGALDSEEERAVREHLASCQESHAEFDALGSVVPVLAESVEQVEPPASLKARIMAAAAADLEARGAGRRDAPDAPAAGIDPPPSIPFPSPAERDARAADRADRIRGVVDAEGPPAARRTSPGEWLFRIAAVVAIVALGVWNLTLQRDAGALRDYQAGVAAVLDVANDPGASSAVMAAQVGGGPSGLAAVGPDGRVAMVLRDLAQLSGNEVYEAWVITGDSPSPIPIGDFRPNPNGTAIVLALTNGTPGATLALTKEPGPGATTPTLPILSVGQTAPPPEG